MKFAYNLWYRYGTPPWVLGPRPELVELVESRRIAPCRAIDLGCGTGDNAIFLAQNGFAVTGIDFSKTAIDKARRKSKESGVTVEFHVDDLTRLENSYGTFDLLVDYGTVDDLTLANRDRYVANILPLTKPGSHFLLWCHEWRLRWWESVLTKTVLPCGDLAFAPGEAEDRFCNTFAIECITRTTDGPKWEPGSAAYLMTRRPDPSATEGTVT